MRTSKAAIVTPTISRELAPTYIRPHMKLPLWVKEIGADVFSENRKIETVEFPASLNQIHPRAFQHCLHLKQISLPEGLHTVGESAFADCTDLSLAELSAGLRVLPRSLFAGDTALKQVRFPKGSQLERIRSLAFCECRALSLLTLPDTVTEIEDRAFYRCRSLCALLPAGLKKVGAQAFYFCPLPDQPLPESLEFIGEAAFFRCRFTSVTIPRSVVHIGDRAFHGSIPLKYLEFHHDPEFIGADIANKIVIIRCKKGSKVDAYCRKYGYQAEYL